jgi:hypothetical protein
MQRLMIGKLHCEPAGGNMAEEMHASREEDPNPKPSEKDKKQWRLNALILAGVVLLSAVLPPEYKAFAPVLFLVPVIVGVVKKIRRFGENSGNVTQDQTYSPPVYEDTTSHEPYSHTPKDPKDPRRYKPIG